MPLVYFLMAFHSYLETWPLAPRNMPHTVSSRGAIPGLTGSRLKDFKEKVLISLVQIIYLSIPGSKRADSKVCLLQ